MFKKYIPPEYKPAKRDQDKCDLCLELKKKILKLKELRNKLISCGCLRRDHCAGDIDDYSDDTPYTPSIRICQHLSNESKQYWFELVDTIAELQYHRDVSHSQNEAYKKDMLLCQTTTRYMMVVCDWKENYTMKGGTIATGRDFYHTVQVSIMGVIVYCKDIDNGKAQKMPIVSNVLTHDGTTAIMNIQLALKKLQTLHSAAFHRLECIKVWADSGPHYRNKEFAYYVLHNMLIEYSLKRSKLNFFGEKHGKNDCDSMFGHISGYLGNAEQSERIDSITKICDVISNAQKCVNDEKKKSKNNKKKKKENNTVSMIPIEWKMSSEEVEQYKTTHKKMEFTGITAYYCMRAESFNLSINGNINRVIYNHGLSLNQQSQVLKWKEGDIKRSKDPKQNPTSDPESDKNSFKTLANANQKLREALQAMDDDTDDEEQDDDVDVGVDVSEEKEFELFLYPTSRIAR